MANRKRSSPATHVISSVVTEDVSTRPECGDTLVTTRMCWLEWTVARFARELGWSVVFMGDEFRFVAISCLPNRSQPARKNAQKRPSTDLDWERLGTPA